MSAVFGASSYVRTVAEMVIWLSVFAVDGMGLAIKTYLHHQEQGECGVACLDEFLCSLMVVAGSLTLAVIACVQIRRYRRNKFHKEACMPSA
mmetsp:Transcript_27965/g.56658  ORF Transcript_27965/g.56658 Transcript_27965/m.56658 type:complete len:92 (+) Transcript_27965:3-278(+)